jgi:hypothetical protein
MRMKKATIFFWGVSIVVVCIHLSNIRRLHTYPFTDHPITWLKLTLYVL